MNRHGRSAGPPEEVYFPVVPMLDMAFQLLAFFILTYQAPSGEARIDLDLPATPAAMPRPTPERGRSDGPGVVDIGLETDLIVRAEADEDGHLRSLRLGDLPLSGPEALADRLRRYAAVLEGRPLRVSLAADDALLYDDASKLIGACSTAGVMALRLVDPAGGSGPGGSP